MKNTTEKTIKEVTEYILELRKVEIWRNENQNTSTHDWDEKKRLNNLTMEKYDSPLVKLNHLLSKHEQFKEVDVIEKRMLLLQEAKLKDFLTPVDVELIYGYSEDTQKTARALTNEGYRLKTVSKAGRGVKVLYKKEDVLKWIERR